MKMNPKKHTAGAILIRLALKISGSNVVSVEPGPDISRKPMMMMTIQKTDDDDDHTYPQQDKVLFVESKAFSIHNSCLLDVFTCNKAHRLSYAGIC